MPPYDSVASFIGSSFDSLQLSPKTVRDHPANNNSSKTKNAYDRIEGSLAALLDFFQYNGVSPASIQELRVELLAKQKYVPLMKRLEEYAKCLSKNKSNESQNDDHDDDSEAAYYLLLNAWEALCEYTHIQHQQAFRSFHVGRLQESQQQHQRQQQSQNSRSKETTGSQERTKLARRLSLPTLRINTSSATTSNNNSKYQQQQQSQSDLSTLQPMTLVELTLLAEQSCSCQKGYILAKKSWTKKIQNINNNNNMQ